MENTTLANKAGEFDPLLAEHKDGLLFADRIRKGLNNHTPHTQLAKYVRWFWQCHIRPHFFQEEKILLPLLTPGHPLAYKVKLDHDEIRELMLLIDEDADRFALQKMARFIESHIAWEDTHLFPYYEKHLTPLQLNKLKKELEDHPVDCKETWKNEFWNIAGN